MAVVFPAQGAPAPDQDNPRTHALVIGIGGYTHLEGGTRPEPEIKRKIGTLGQLTTAPRSARAFSDFVIAAADLWQAPLGSVDLILSAKPGDDAALPDNHPAGAGFDDIQDAYDAWRARCDSHPDNIALFYFCGHGVEKDEHILLTEDFGRSASNPWRGSFAFDSTVLGFRSCKANTQCFFIDSCREITTPLKNHDIDSSPLETPRLAQKESEFSFLMKSTAGKETALGPPEGVAYATQALIRALSGDAAAPEGSAWVVRTGGIADKITDILGLVKTDEDFKQRCPCSVTKSTSLLELADAPTVRLKIGCVPVEATEVAALTCTRLTMPGAPAAPILTSAGEVLSLDVEAGFYFAQARFDGNEFREIANQVLALPPKTQHDLECTTP